ncbi:coat protein [Ficus tepovirus A]|nr:coat protein [Ficus tepovirus A]
MGITKKERLEIMKEVDGVLTTKFKGQVPQGQQFSIEVLHFLQEYIFGNIALKGASELTEWEDVEVTSGKWANNTGFHTARNLELELPGEINRELRAAAFSFKVNLHTLTQSLTALANSSSNVFVSNKSLRRLCVPYAERAKTYLSIRKVDGEYTNLVQKMPDTCRLAPEVCFDFNEGLDVLKLTDVQARVMQKLQRRLFATELKKRESDRVSEDHIGDQL